MNSALPPIQEARGASPLLGTVLARQANYYQVRLDPLEKLKVEAKRVLLGRGCQVEAKRVLLGRGSEELKVESLLAKQGSLGAAPQDLAQLEDSNQSSNIPYGKGTRPQPPNLQPSTLLCTRRSRLKKIGQNVMVGDRVQIEEPDWAGGRGAIAEVLPRQTHLDRPPIANANQIMLVFALADPPLDAYQLSRFLVKGESTGLDVSLCLNKSDLVTPEQLNEWRARLRSWGYQPVFISVSTGAGLEEVETLHATSLPTQLKDKSTVLAGLSGVGKSSIINHLIPGVNLRVAEVSGKLSRGRHTTRHVELFELPTGGLLADTPGFNQPDLDCSPEELVYYFPEARQRLAEARCQFSNCLHRDEPNCAVRGDWERYEYYLDLLEEAIAQQEYLNQQADPESALKLKTKGKGHSQYEPRLETKKYRRPSRRTQQQALQEVYQDAEE